MTGTLLRGRPRPCLERVDVPLLDGELASLDTVVGYQQWNAGRHEPSVPEPSVPEPSGAGPSGQDDSRVVVTDERLLVDHPRRGLLSLWHVDLENLQLGRPGQQWHLDLHPVGINPCVRLSGGAAPLVAVHVAHAVFPGTWARLSGLLPLTESAA